MSGQKSVKSVLKSVTIIGLGQIGLPLAVLAALRGYKVHGVDIDSKRLESIRTLDDRAMESALVFFLQDQQVIDNLLLQESIQSKTDFFVVCVNTPLGENKLVNLSILEAATLSIVPFLKVGSVIIIESTVTVGFTRNISLKLEKLSGMKAGKDFYVAYTPERLLPGQAFRELIFNDRIIGGISEASSTRAMEFYTPMIKGECFLTTAETAELSKIVENCHRAVQIAFANEIADVAKELNIDPFSLIDLANRHPRVKIASPGIGVGGDCVPVHPYFLQNSLSGGLPSLISKALTVNVEQESKVANLILREINTLRSTIKNRKPVVLLLGLTYKPNVLDLRNSPAFRIAKMLLSTPNIDLRVYDPLIDSMKILELGFESLSCFSQYKMADIIVFLVAHDKFAPFKEVDLSGKVCIDPIGFLRKTHLSVLKKELSTNG